MQNKRLMSVLLTLSAIGGPNTLAATHLKGTDFLLTQSKASGMTEKKPYIIVFNTPSVLNTRIAGAVAEYALRQADTLENRYGVTAGAQFGDIINAVQVEATAKEIWRIKRDPSVKYVESVATTRVAPVRVSAATSSWGLDRVDQRELPLDGNYDYQHDGSGVTAYIIDTGVLNSHHEFGGRAVSGYDFYDDDPDATDCHGHGTHVAGTIGGSTWGMAKNVNLVGLRVLSCGGYGSTTEVIQALNWINSNRTGPAVANISLQFSASQALNDAVNAAVAAGINVVVAAGNWSTDACSVSPAGASNAITVAASDRDDSRAGWSNYGSCIDIFAPGVDITSAMIGSDTNTATWSGTSMASPHVAGAVALMLAGRPHLQPVELRNELIERATKNKISNPAGSANRLLYSLEDVVCASCPPPPCSEDCPESGIFTNNNQLILAPDSQVSSAIQVSFSGPVKKLEVTLELEHSAVEGLSLVLFSPAGNRYVLQDKIGNAGLTTLLKTYVITVSEAADISTQGEWRLEVVNGAQSSGVLKRWQLQLFDEFRVLYGNRSAYPISDVNPVWNGWLSSSASVWDIDRGAYTVLVRVRVDHPMPDNLELSLIGPSGREYPVKRSGSPFYGDGVERTFPAGTREVSRQGIWQLKVRDPINAQTGTLNYWYLEF
ncbi:S8 family serine peptidase [Shewanella sp. GXUN23E]|uniref:S8 family serine peptidase n=1 Tax=Shewanella sp. GXUN23E TaxID=3422498 RepID=UPI003D7D227C